MKQEDFDEIKNLIEPKGFELINGSVEDNEKFFVIAKKKDIWEGVEFCAYFNVGRQTFLHRKIDKISGEEIYFSNGHWMFKLDCKPSTEQAYVEQLKKEAFERFGDIKEGQEFVWTSTCVYKTNRYNDGWDYVRLTDSLYYKTALIYQSGKWAERVKERVEVESLGGVYGGIRERAFASI